MKDPNVFFHRDILLTDLGGGLSRKVLAYDRQMMIVEVHFEAGGVGTLHTHPHLQLTYVKSGRFRFNIEGKEVEVSGGDTIRFPSGAEHGTLCLEAGVLLDIFSPMREDFL